MAYTPPPPGHTTVGEPTPDDVPKQDAHIRDLPPEVRRSFLMSMVFFPSIVGAGICLVLFLGFWFLKEPQKADLYARQLREGIKSGTKRTRWQTARRIAENLDSPEVQNPMVLSALLEIVKDPSLDEEVDVWSPGKMIRTNKENASRLRWWAAYLSGYIAARLNDPRGVKVLIETMREQDEAHPEIASGLRFFTAAGLGVLKDPKAIPVLSEAIRSDGDNGVRAVSAKSLGAIGAEMLRKINEEKKGTSGVADGKEDGTSFLDLNNVLQEVYFSDMDTDVKWNTAIALARIGNATGRKTLDKLILHKDAVVQRNAKQALDILDAMGKSKK